MRTCEGPSLRYGRRQQVKDRPSGKLVLKPGEPSSLYRKYTLGTAGRARLVSLKISIGLLVSEVNSDSTGSFIPSRSLA